VTVTLPCGQRFAASQKNELPTHLRLETTFETSPTEPEAHGQALMMKCCNTSSVNHGANRAQSGSLLRAPIGRLPRRTR